MCDLWSVVSEWDHEIECSRIHIHIHIWHGLIETNKERVSKVNEYHPGEDLPSVGVARENESHIIPNNSFNSCTGLVGQNNGWDTFSATSEGSINVHDVGTMPTTLIGKEGWRGREREREMKVMR